MASWDETPHLSAEAKAELIQSYPLHERGARTKGTPQLGSGAIYPVPEEDIACDPFDPPIYWPRGFSLDVGWNRTSAGLWALDREADVLYRIAEYYRGQAEPSVHAAAIRAWGPWLPGVIDPAARGRSQIDGEQLFQMYSDLGLLINPADNAREAGIFAVWQRLSTGRLKVFKICQSWFSEYRLYRRDDKGQVVKQDDHAMDDTRYMVMSGISVMTVDPAYLKKLGKAPLVTTDYDPYVMPDER